MIRKFNLKALLADPIYGYSMSMPEEEKKKISQKLIEKINILTKPSKERTEEHITKLINHFGNLEFFQRVSKFDESTHGLKSNSMLHNCCKYFTY